MLNIGAENRCVWDPISAQKAGRGNIKVGSYRVNCEFSLGSQKVDLTISKASNLGEDFESAPIYWQRQHQLV